MAYVDRFSVSLDTELLAAFDDYIRSRGYENRSEAIRDLIRTQLSEARIEDQTTEVVAVISLSIDRSVPTPGDNLRGLLLNHAERVVGSMVIPISTSCDAVTVTLRGQLGVLRSITGQIEAIRGTYNAKTSVFPVAIAHSVQV